MSPTVRPMTITEKIIASRAGRCHTEPGELLTVKVDFAMANDITAPMALEAFEEIGAERVFDPDRIALVLSHFLPAKYIDSAGLGIVTRQFARKYGITHFFGVGEGIEHVLLPENGLVLPGEIVLGADSHTCTYGALGCLSTGVGSTDLAYTLATGETWMRVPEAIRCEFTGRLGPWVTGKDLILYTIGHVGCDGAAYKTLEFTGEALSYLGMSDRFTMANMAVEAGAKNGIFNPDSQTADYVGERAVREFTPVRSDPDASYAQEHYFDAGSIQPQVAFPHSPDNTRPVSEATHVSIDRVFIGSCTNGRLEDLQAAARILHGRRVHAEVDAMVIPATRGVYAQALRQGLLEIFVEAGAMVSVPTCGPCLGGHMGVLGRGERCVSTSNRNFVGRMGHTESRVYLAGPAVAAASAVAGRICHPGELGVEPDEVRGGSNRP